MNPLVDFGILTFASIFVIVDPVGLTPAFLVMTARDKVKDRIRMAGLACLITLIVLVLCALGGEKIFGIFGITLPAFEIAGGLVLLLVSLDMLQARRTAVKETAEEQSEGVHKHDIAITPLAIPMLAGPGAITTVILLGSKAVTIQHQFILYGNILAVCFISFLILRFAAVKSAWLSVIALRVLMRLMGLLLTAISVQFIINGLKAAHLFS